MTNYVDSRSINGWGIVTETISDATRSNPVILTITGHGYSNGQLIQAVSGVVGMTQLNGNDYYANNVTANTVELYSDAGLTTTVDGTGFSAYTSGGIAERVLTGTALTSAGFTKYVNTQATVANIQTNIQPAVNHRLVINKIKRGYTGHTYKVSVQNTGEGNRYTFDGEELGSFELDTKHRMYIFEQNDISNNGHPLYFSETQDGAHNGGTEFNPTKDAATGLSGTAVEYYLDGVKQTTLANYSAGFNAATSREVWVVGAVPAGGKLYSVCYTHSGMGGGTGYTVTDATYDPANGILEATIGTHSLAVGHNVEIAQDSITMTCTSDSNATNHTYPRSTDPAKAKVFVKIIAKTATTITVNVGASPSGQQYAHTFVSAVANSINTPASNKPTIVYRTTTQHSTDVAYWERYSGPYNTTTTVGNGVTITAQDGQFATTASAEANLGQHGFSLVLAGLSEEPRPGASIQFTTGPTYNPDDNVDLTRTLNTGADGVSYIITGVSGYTPSNDPTVLSTCTVTLATEKPKTSHTYYGQKFNIRYRYSQTRLTGHDFLSIGTGGRASTNYPGEPTQAASQGNEVTETYPGRVYFVSTDQDGNFRVGNYFRVDQSTGRATLDASAFDLAGLTSLRLGSIGAQLGESINEFSADGALTGNSNTAVPTEQAVKTYVDNKTTIAIGAANNAVLTKAFDIGNLNRNASGEITGVTHESVTYSNVVYTGENITGYRETSANGTIKDVTVTYSTDGKIATVVTVAGS
jgi:hypothetical protein